MLKRGIRCCWVLIVGFVSSGSEVTSAEDPPAERRYDAGPLAIEDFQAAVPDPLPNLGRLRQYGFADSDIHFRMSYRYRNAREGVEVTLKEIDIFGVFLREKSWLARTSIEAIDHEQGHFDITQTYALDAKLQMKQRLIDGKTLIGRGPSREEAVSDLEGQIRELLKPVYDRAASAQQIYDRQTQHGTLAAQQTAHRKRQLELLEKMIDDLRELDPAEEQ